MKKIRDYKQEYELHGKKWTENNKERHLNLIKTWRKNNPEKVLETQMRYRAKTGKFFSMAWNEFHAALAIWSRCIKKRDELCLNCGSDDKLEAHHQYPKADFPELALDFNNGYTLCNDCHKEETWGMR